MIRVIDVEVHDDPDKVAAELQAVLLSRHVVTFIGIVEKVVDVPNPGGYPQPLPSRRLFHRFMCRYS